jgi:hypothetical protein
MNYILGIKNNYKALDFLRKSRILLMICCVYIMSITVGALAIFGFAFGLNYKFSNFLLFGIPWITIWGFWCLIACMPSHYFPVYFFIICYHLKQRLNSIRIRLNIIRLKSKILTSNEKTLMIGRLLEEHNDLCQQICNYNKYWKKFLTIFYSIFMSIVCILTYVVFIFPGLKWFLRVEYAVVLSGHLLVIIIITYSASSVSHFNHKLNRNLCSFMVKNCLSIDIKMKVKLKIKTKK